MPEIRYQQPGGSPEIVSAEIHIPNASDLGTGTFTIVLIPRALLSDKTIMSMIGNPPVFQISATINPNRNVVVLLGKADGSNPFDQVVFRVPHGLDLRVSQTLKVEFAGWRIVAASLNGQALSLY